MSRADKWREAPSRPAAHGSAYTAATAHPFHRRENIESDGAFVLKSEISPEKAIELRTLHRLSDWVITLDRNAGMEYFDSPRDNRDIYDAYVIDCVPEREDLGCLQLITSTSNLEEVRRLLDGALDQMGLSHSRRNAEFLMSHLKALTSSLAIRLTGPKSTNFGTDCSGTLSRICPASGGRQCVLAVVAQWLHHPDRRCPGSAATCQGLGKRA